MSERQELDGMAAYWHAIQNPSQDNPTWPLPSFDPMVWAETFCKQHKDCDKDIMVAWFANALMRGYDEARLRGAPEIRSLRTKLAAARDAALEDAAEIADGQGEPAVAAEIRAMKGPRP